MTKSLLALAAITACGGGQKEVAVEGSDTELVKLAGDWEGDYKGVESGRTGPVKFSLQVGSHVAEGEVFMGGQTPLKIEFVQIKGGQVKGTIAPYNDPRCNCQVATSLHLAGDNPFEPPPGLDSTQIPNFNPANGLGTDRSDYIAGVYLSPVSGLSLIAQARFDERDFSLRRQDTAIQGTYGPLLTQFAYTFTQFDPKFGVFDDQQEIIGTLGLRLTERWSVVGQMRFDIDASERVQDILQLKYADECFVLTASYIETFVENQALDIRKDQTLMLRFELKHLGQYNYRTDTLSGFFGDTNQGRVP